MVLALAAVPLVLPCELFFLREEFKAVFKANLPALPFLLHFKMLFLNYLDVFLLNKIQFDVVGLLPLENELYVAFMLNSCFEVLNSDLIIEREFAVILVGSTAKLALCLRRRENPLLLR